MLDVSIRPFAVRGTMERVGGDGECFASEVAVKLENGVITTVLHVCHQDCAIDSNEESHRFAPMGQRPAAL